MVPMCRKIFWKLSSTKLFNMESNAKRKSVPNKPTALLLIGLLLLFVSITGKKIKMKNIFLLYFSLLFVSKVISCF
jgi:hypothetical protein